MQFQIKFSKSTQASILGKNYTDYTTFMGEFNKLLWLTYRKSFAPLLIEKNKVAKLTSDAGWGCVMRCTQMLLANCLRTVFTPSSSESQHTMNIRILNLFDDDKRNITQNAFSIQNVVEIGLNEHNRMPGEWYGVSKMNEIFKTLNETYNFSTNLSGNMLG